MDRKTLVSSVFAASVVTGAAVTTVAVPDLRSLWLRNVRDLAPGFEKSVPDMNPPSRAPLRHRARRSALAANEFEFEVDSSLDPNERASATGGCTSNIEDTRLTARATADGVLVVWLWCGDWSCHETWRLELRKRSDALIASVSGSWWVDMGQPIIEGQTPTRSDDGTTVDLTAIEACIAVESTDWSPGRTVALRIDLDCEFAAKLCCLSARGAAVIQPPK